MFPRACQRVAKLAAGFGKNLKHRAGLSGSLNAGRSGKVSDFFTRTVHQTKPRSAPSAPSALSLDGASFSGAGRIVGLVTIGMLAIDAADTRSEGLADRDVRCAEHKDSKDLMPGLRKESGLHLSPSIQSQGHLPSQPQPSQKAYTLLDLLRKSAFSPPKDDGSSAVHRVGSETSLTAKVMQAVVARGLNRRRAMQNAKAQAQPSTPSQSQQYPSSAPVSIPGASPSSASSGGPGQLLHERDDQNESSEGSNSESDDETSSGSAGTGLSGSPGSVGVPPQFQCHQQSLHADGLLAHSLAMQQQDEENESDEDSTPSPDVLQLLNARDTSGFSEPQSEAERALKAEQVVKMTEEASRFALERPEFKAAFDAFKKKVNSNGRLVLHKEDFGDPLRWKALGYFLASCPDICVLRLQGMEITKEDAAALGNGVLKQIRHITFCGNNIGLNAGSLDMLVAVLLLCEYIESASILHNSLHDQHMSHILRLITEHSSLATLDLCWNGIGDEGADQLAAALKRLRDNVTRIDLSYNQIGAQGHQSLAIAQQALKRATRRNVQISLVGNGGIRSLLWKKPRRRRPLLPVIQGQGQNQQSALGTGKIGVAPGMGGFGGFAGIGAFSSFGFAGKHGLLLRRRGNNSNQQQSQQQQQSSPNQVQQALAPQVLQQQQSQQQHFTVSPVQRSRLSAPFSPPLNYRF